jgi:hypothetical protein
MLNIHKVKVYLKNTNSVTYPVVRKSLMPVLKKIEYIYNEKSSNYVLDCQHLTNDRMKKEQAEIINVIKKMYNNLNNVR